MRVNILGAESVDRGFGSFYRVQISGTAASSAEAIFVCVCRPGVDSIRFDGSNLPIIDLGCVHVSSTVDK